METRRAGNRGASRALPGPGAPLLPPLLPPAPPPASTGQGPPMSTPALALAPVLVDDRPRPGAGTRTLDAELLERATRDDYQHWLSTALAAGGCVRPIRLRGTVRDIDTATGEILRDLDTERPAGQGDLRPVRGPARLGLPAVRRDLPGRHLPAHPRRARRRQRRPRVGRHPPVRVRHLHRPLLRPRPHPRHHPRRQGRPLPAPAQGQLLPARAAALLRPAAQGRRRLPGQAAVPGLLRLPRRGRVERPRPRAVAPHRHRHPPPPRQARQGPRRPGQAVLRQGRRVPAPRPDPLPRHLPPRRPRPRPPRTHRPAPPGAHRRRAGRRHPAGRQRDLVRHRPPPGQAERLGHHLGRPGRPPRRPAHRRRRDHRRRGRLLPGQIRHQIHRAGRRPARADHPGQRPRLRQPGAPTRDG